MPRHLYRDVRRRAKSVQPQPPRLACARQPQGAVAYHARTQQRRGLLIRKPAGNGISELFAGYLVVSIPAVNVIAREASVVTQVLLPALAVRAHPVGPVQPGHPHTVPRLEPGRGGSDLFHNAHYLMTWYDRQRW